MILRDLNIPTSGFYIGVAKNDLKGANIRTIFQMVASEAMS